MKFTLPWLKEHLETTASLEEITGTLTSLGIEVEEVSDPAAALAGFSVAHVKEARPHPNADRLRLCTVETASGVFEVVCGAPNARTGMKGIFAPEGSVIPASGEVLKRATIRGVASSGMLCSARELRIGEEHDGIIELPQDLPVGMAAAEALGIEGPVIEVKVTPDRGDCFGVGGLARDLAAAGLGRHLSRDATPVPPTSDARIPIRIDFPPEEAGACPLFVGRVLRGLRNGPSPAWLQRRLKAIGLRPISALVDITNYVTFDLCRPLHVFDAARLEGGITVRSARAGEELLALDGRTYRLEPGMTVIADEHGPQGLGGVMGGEMSGVSDATTEVVLEVALFDPVRTARTGRRLGISSDARTRFERGVDTGFVLAGAEHATRLILSLCGGEAGPLIVAGTVPSPPPPVRYRPSSLARLAGIELEAQETERLLTALGFTLAGSPDSLIIAPPTWRHDVSTEACIVEELTRLHGYDRIPPVPVRRTEAVNPKVLPPALRRRGQLRRLVGDLGYVEAVTWSFVAPLHARLFGGEELIAMRNPINAELSVMRPSLLPGLLTAAARNVARASGEGALFELGPRFTGSRPGEQAWALAGIRFGQAAARHWSTPTRPVDALDAKADAQAALAAAGQKVDQAQISTDAPAWFHPGRSGRWRLGPRPLASFGELHPEVLAAFELALPVVAFELDLDDLPLPKARADRTRPPLEPLPFPPADRDFAFVVDREVAAEDLLRAVRGAERKLVREVRLFDVYEGPGMPPGKKSLAVAVRLQASDRTLTESEIEEVAGRVVAATQKATGAVLRG